MAQYSNIHRPNVGFVWTITDIVLRDTFKKSEIGDVILPFVVLRRMDCILAPYNEAVRNQYEQFKDKISLEKLDPLLRKTAGGLKFYNTSRHTLTSLLDDAKNVSINFNNYMTGFNAEVQTIFQCFQFDKVVARLNRSGLLYKMIQAITEQDFSLDKVDNHDMGYVFEELIRIANDQSNEQAGEHFTPRDVIRVMSAIMFTPDAEDLRHSNIIRTIYDPACGTGGMLNVGKRYILEEICADSDKPSIITHGQELNEQSFAIAKSEALVSGENADNIRLGNSFTQDQFPNNRFNYIMANPPYGVTWKKDQDFIIEESQNPEGRFFAGTPRTTDGQLLFIQHMLSKMRNEGSRVGVVTNGAPLFSGGTGSGESNIRKWIIENDWLECIVALPNELFYNTPIATYIWFFTNKKSAQRKGKVQLINAVDFCKLCTKSLGNKRYDILEEHVQQILQLYLNFEDNEFSKIFPNKEFGHYELTIEQPLRNADGSLKLKSGKVQPDSKKRDTERIRLDADWKEYFQEEVLPHIDPESWVDLAKTRKYYEINFTHYFFKFQQPESSEVIADRILQSERLVSEMISSLFND